MGSLSKQQINFKIVLNEILSMADKVYLSWRKHTLFLCRAQPRSDGLCRTSLTNFETDSSILQITFIRTTLKLLRHPETLKYIFKVHACVFVHFGDSHNSSRKTRVWTLKRDCSSKKA